jgi:hypothetical protein
MRYAGRLRRAGLALFVTVHLLQRPHAAHRLHDFLEVRQVVDLDEYVAEHRPVAGIDVGGLMLVPMR